MIVPMDDTASDHSDKPKDDDSNNANEEEPVNEGDVATGDAATGDANENAYKPRRKTTILNALDELDDDLDESDEEDLEESKLVPGGDDDDEKKEQEDQTAANKKKLCIGTIICLLVVIGAAVAIVFTVVLPKGKEPTPIPENNEQGGSNEIPAVNNTDNTDNSQLNNSRQEAFNAIKQVSPTIPASITFDQLSTMAELSNATAQIKAAEWILYHDQTPPNFSGVGFQHRYVLATIYHKTAPWTKSTDWLSQKNICEWYGVSCHNETGKLVELKLPANNLVGELPEEIGLLTTLTDLVLTKNKLIGILPWGSLVSLTELELLDLRENEFEGDLSTVDFKRLHKLEDLLLSHNKFGGDVPQDVMLPTSLETFNFDNNNMTGAIPDVFCKEFQFTADCLNDTPISCICCDKNSTMYKCI